MLIIIVLTVVVFVAALKEIWVETGVDSFFSGFMAFIGAVAMGALGGCVGAGVAYLIGMGVGVKWTDHSVELATLRSTTGTQGQFYLGTGEISQSQYYLFYQKVGGGYVPGQVSVSDNVIVHEENRDNGTLVWRDSDFTNSVARLVAIRSKGYQYEFHIPAGSIKQGYRLE